jgi:four helix bundle protein
MTEVYPKEEKFGLVSQIRRAAISISSNIAEGSSRRGNKDKSRFYEIAYGSLIEVLNQLILSNDLEYISEKELSDIRPQIVEIGKLLSGLYKSSRNRQ